MYTLSWPLSPRCPLSPGPSVHVVHSLLAPLSTLSTLCPSCQCYPRSVRVVQALFTLFTIYTYLSTLSTLSSLHSLSMLSTLSTRSILSPCRPCCPRCPRLADPAQSPVQKAGKLACTGVDQRLLIATLSSILLRANLKGSHCLLFKWVVIAFWLLQSSIPQNQSPPTRHETSAQC